jgi:hypothetical protein
MPARQPTVERPREPGLPAAASVALLVVLAALGGLLDLATGTGLRYGYGIGFLVGCLASALLVQHSHRLWPVFAPPFVFTVVAFLASYRDHDFAFSKVQVGGDTVTRMVEPGKALYLVLGVVLAEIIATVRHLRHR